jgi:hypothetical protein
MTCGLDQHIAVYPKEIADKDNNKLDDQGTLWKLLRRIEVTPWNDSHFEVARRALWTKMAEVGWYLAMDGVLRDYQTGEPVGGKEIRQTLTPLNGKVIREKHMEIAAEWARLFHAVFNHRNGHQAQVEYGKEHLVKRTKRRKLKIPAGTFSVEKIAYGQELTSLKVEDLGEELDLALCMYQANSVNAPAVANKIIRKALYRKNFAKTLIHLLGNSKYGRWDDDIPGGRYQRTRLAARGSGLWPRKLFDGADAIMPKNLPG